jgi:membrane protease YdiL (CAAX protease family)
MLFHWGVYGQNPEFLWATFALGVVLAFAYDYTGHLSVPVAIHFLINLLATRGVIYFIPPPI